MVRAIAVRGFAILIILALLAACGGGASPSPTTTSDTPSPEPTATPKPTSTPEPTAIPTPEPPRAVAAGDPGTPGAGYPTRWATGEIAYGEQAMNLIALPGTAERAAFEAELASMGTGAPTAERVLALNTTDAQNPSWTYLLGNGQKLFVAVVRDGGVEKIDPSLHDWRVSNVSGVEMVRWQEVTPPPGSDNLRLIANGTTTVIGAYQGDTLVYWLSTEANNGQGDWLPNDSNLPEGAGDYHFNNDLNTWVAEAGGVIFEYRGGQWMEVVPTPTPEPTAEVVDAATELARGLEAFAASPVSGQLEMVYSVHPEIRINPEPAKNLYNYFIEVVTTSKGFEPYWQALGLWDHAGIMNYLEQNNYRVPTQVGEQFWPTIRFSNDSYIINGQESDWVRGDKRLETIDLSSLGFMLTDNEQMGDSAYADEVKALYGQGNIGYGSDGTGGALRYQQNGKPVLMVKEVEAASYSAVDVSLLNIPVGGVYAEQLAMHAATLVRALSTSTPYQPEANNCMIPGWEKPMRRGSCLPDTAEGIQYGGTEYHGANIHTLNRLGLTGLFTIQP